MSAPASPASERIATKWDVLEAEARTQLTELQDAIRERRLPIPLTGASR